MRRAALCLLLAAGALFAQDLASMKDAFRASRDESTLSSLLAYRRTLAIDSNFEVDYMIALTLATLPRYQDKTCDFITAIGQTYSRPFVFDGRQVTLDALSTRFCPPPPPPGTMTTYELRRKRPSAVLATLPPVLPPAPAAASADGWDGVYNMVHDGWKGELVIGRGGGSYFDANRVRHLVRVMTRNGNHIVFAVVGLGGENADGSGGQKFDGYLMSQTRDAIAGVTWWQGQPFGFYAIKR
jgi:hypothetical protein